MPRDSYASLVESESKMEIDCTDGKTLMAQGPHAMLEHVRDKLETSLGKVLPRMDVRFLNLSLSADFIVADSRKKELPTIGASLRKLVSRRGNRLVTKHILKNVSGVFKPGTMTLVLGQPGSGKSALMKVLSGRFPMTKNMRFEGEVSYNGRPREKLLKQLPQFVAYVPQQDKHLATLTVKETLEFAHACCGGEKLADRDEAHFTNGSEEQIAAAVQVNRALNKHYPDVVIQQLGLENCQNTIVGSSMLRGISGGERKRVTTGEMQFGNKYVTLMDEISTGLDSAATFDIVNTQRSIAKTLGKTVVIALLQPSPEVFELFDNVLIMNKGQVMYHGPRTRVVAYFRDLGFECPPEKDVADFLLDLGTDQQEKYRAGWTSRTRSFRRIPRLADDFASMFAASIYQQSMLRDMQQPHDLVSVLNHEAHMDPVPEFHQDFWDSTKTLMKRQAKVTMRNSAYLKGRAIMVTVMGLLYASVFYQLNATNVQVVLGIVFSTTLFLSLGQASQIPTFLAAREVFYKQRGANFFRTASYVLSCSVSQLPLVVMESVIFGSIVYWMCGFKSTVEGYGVFMLLLFLTNLTFAAWFFFISCVVPDLHVAKPASMVTNQIFILFAGFVLTKEQIPTYFVWIYWINPVSWCVRSLAVNQYRDERFDVCEYEDIAYCDIYGKTMGEYSLSVFDMPGDELWVLYGIGFMIVSYVVFMTLAYLALEYRRLEAPVHVNLEKEQGQPALPIATKSRVKSVMSMSSVYSLMDTQSRRGFEIQVQRERHFVPVTLAFQDLWYSVPDPAQSKSSINLLKGVSGFATPGTMTALMGSSGAGKTTLMDVIAGRKAGGTIRGTVFLNGYEATDLAIRRCTGYCEQMDIHSEASTFREALYFSAFLRQSSDVSDQHKVDSVNECLDLMGLTPIADQMIRGSSMEQMKRLTIGVELAAQPSVLFLDEPTSGLDARSAKVIMDGVRKVANTGRTVVCTIHQPSSDVFALFDSLLLLKRGGETVYFGNLGTSACELTNYFEKIPNVPRLPEGYNPATWMLEAIGAGVDNAGCGADTDFARIFRASAQNQTLQIDLNLAGMTRPNADVVPLEFSSKRAAKNLTQLKLLTHRFFRIYWRTPSYNLTRLIISMMLGLLFGLIYSSMDFSTYKGVNAGLGMVFMTTVFVGFVSFNSVLPITCEERASFYRERASQTYNALWYFVASTVAEVPYVAMGSLLFTSMLFPLVGFRGMSKFLFYWLNTALHVLLQTYIGQFLAYALPTVELAAVIGVLLNSVFFLFMGFNPPASSIPKGYKWLYSITPQKYTLSILSSTMFGDCPDNGDGNALGCQTMNDTPPSIPLGTTVKTYIESVFLMKHSTIMHDFAVVLGLIVVFRIAGLFALRYSNHQKK